MRFRGLNTRCAELNWASRQSDPSDPDWCFSRVRGAQPGGPGGNTWLLFHSKKVTGGALPIEDKTRLLLLAREGPPRDRSFTQTRCQNWDPPECGRAKICFQPIAPAEGGGGQGDSSKPCCPTSSWPLLAQWFAFKASFHFPRRADPVS